MKLNFAAAHRRLWLWLAANPTMHKVSWPEWEFNGGKIPFCSHGCFACEMDNQSFCTLTGGTCRIGVTGECFPLYDHWWTKAIVDADIKYAAIIAHKIANMKWHGPKMKEI